ncbi:hypothetical protein [Streptomyces sp. NPDC001980]|uniref:hypothetical protein n=1 Tax=Streptomyces sp. NPDC001980 TaxID=3157126 RepID=UPI003324CF79
MTREGARLTCSPGRIDPTSDAWDDSRRPLVGEFVFHGQTVFAEFADQAGDHDPQIVRIDVGKCRKH